MRNAARYVRERHWRSLEPTLLTVPKDTGLYSLFEAPLGRIAEVVDGWLDVALPVALREDVELIVVQGVHLAG